MERVDAARAETHFYPRSPRGERLVSWAITEETMSISIHAPREGSDAQHIAPQEQWVTNFYPRSPRGERPVTKRHHFANVNISIHAPREGSDHPPHSTNFGAGDISIHAPREGSDAGRCSESTVQKCISIHAPREGSDMEYRPFRSFYRYFYPRSPRGERRRPLPEIDLVGEISIHAPREGSDVRRCAPYCQ